MTAARGRGMFSEDWRRPSVATVSIASTLNLISSERLAGNGGKGGAGATGQSGGLLGGNGEFQSTTSVCGGGKGGQGGSSGSGAGGSSISVMWSGTAPTLTDTEVTLGESGKGGEAVGGVAESAGVAGKKEKALVVA